MTRSAHKSHASAVLWLLAGCLAIGGSVVARAEHPLAEKGPGPLLKSMLDGPMADVEDIVFAVRVPGRDHWYVTFGYYACDYGPGPEQGFGLYPDGKSIRGYGDGARLSKMNLRTGKVDVILEDKLGGIRDPQMHYDGRKILFSYRKGGTATFHLYEINVDGTGLRQLTDGPDDDIEPAYLPDGNIMFCSSRCRRFVNCWYSRVATLYVCDGDGQGVRMISSNNDHDNTPWVLPDGRILYMRWEYVDRSQVHFHHLWTVNPDGTGQMTFYGNEFAGVAMLDAKPIPGSDKIVASFSPGHGRPEHLGHVTIVDPSTGPDDPGAARHVSKRADFKDPFAISENCFLVAHPSGLFVMDGQGNTELIYRLPESDRHLHVHEPRVLAPRPRERIVPSRIDLSREDGELVLNNIYHGRNMKGVKPGEIKKLLVLEQLPEPVHFSGGMEPLTIGGTFTMARVLGTVPVEPDGSAYMRLPPLRSLFFVALDENDLSVKRMQSFVTMQPGERTGCVGCHERRTLTARPTPILGLAATLRPASPIEPIADMPDVFDFSRDIQPILDKHCVECHNVQRRDGYVDLTGDFTPRYTISYRTIVAMGLVADGRNQPHGNRAARTIGSSASRLMKLIDGTHYEAKLSDRERSMVRLWIESSATYPGTYAALGCGMYHVHLPGAVLTRRCGNCHGDKVRAKKVARPHYKMDNFGALQVLCNITHPEKSLLLMAPLAKEAGGLGLCTEGTIAGKDDADYKAILAAINRTHGELQVSKRFSMPGFRPNKYYIREMQRFGILPADLGPEDPIDVYKTDREYWKSFWHKPVKPGNEVTATRP